MKKLIIPTILMLSLIISCNQQKDDKQESETAKSSNVQQVQTDSSISFYDKGIKTGRFYIDSSALEIAAFLKDRKLNDLARTYALGGTFKISEFFPKNIDDTTKGVVLWFCFNPFNANLSHKLFVSAEPRDINQHAGRPTAVRMNIPDSVFRYEHSNISYSFIKKYLADHTIKPSPNRKSPLDSSQVRRLMGNFDTYRHQNPNQHGHLYVKYLGAYFQNNKEKATDSMGLLTRFVNQPEAEYVRYYLAYNESINGDNNKIRIILVAVDKNGKNITMIKSPVTKGDQEALILQKSVPPGPGGK